MADFLIVGGGAVGLAIALEVKRRFGGSVCLIEKEDHTGAHSSGRNSGVLHAGIYYKPGTLKAKLSVDGNRSMREYCDDHQIPQVRGKVIVAQNDEEVRTLHSLAERARDNGAEIKLINEEELAEIEHYAATTGVALYSPNTMTVDPHKVMDAMRADAEGAGIEVRVGTRMVGLGTSGEALTNRDPIQFGYLVNAAGAYADTIAHWYGVGENYVMIPYKGLYWQLKPEFADLVRSNVYPVPDIRFPFLGIHFTRTPKGVVKVGPTAIPAWSKENYSGFKGLRGGELGNALRYNCRKLLDDHNYRLLALREVSHATRYFFYRDAKKLIPKLSYGALARYPQATGIRAQLFDIKKKELESDFVVLPHEKSLHILNAVSPAFTCSLAFARYVADQIR